MSDTLRDYQVAAFEALRTNFRQGCKRQILVAPTGSGKTTIAAAMVQGAVKLGKRVMFVAHRKELIDQAHARITSHDVEAGVIMADHPLKRPDLPVQVASVQTLARRERWPECELLIIDEAHHAAAKSYEALFETYPNAWVVGLTATPWRLDGKGLSPTFERVVVASTPAELIQRGYLCEYRGFCFLPPELAGIKVTGGDYDKAQLEGAVTDAKVLGNVVDEWAARASHLKTIVFAITIKHAEELAKRFRERGVTVATIDHHMNKVERESILAGVRNGTTRVIVNVGILGEGVDIPDLECAVLARPTKSLALYLQQVGRVMRPAAGKVRAVIHDHGNMVQQHGLPDDERDYSLTTTRKKQPALASLRTCPECFAILEGNPAVCPECGHEFDGSSNPRDMKEGRGVAVDMHSVKKSREALLAQLEAQAIANGYKPGWLVHQYLKQFPTAPKPWGAFRRVRDAQRR